MRVIIDRAGEFYFDSGYLPIQIPRTADFRIQREKESAMTKPRKTLKLTITAENAHVPPIGVVGVVTGMTSTRWNHGEGTVATRARGHWFAPDGCPIDFRNNSIEFDTGLPAKILTLEDLTLPWPDGSTAIDVHGDAWLYSREAGGWRWMLPGGGLDDTPNVVPAPTYLPFRRVTLPPNALEQIFGSVASPSDEETVEADLIYGESETPQADRRITVPINITFEVAGEEFAGVGSVVIDAIDPRARGAASVRADIVAMLQSMADTMPTKLLGPVLLEIEKAP